LYPDVPDNYRARLDLAWPVYSAGRTDALERAAVADLRSVRNLPLSSTPPQPYLPGLEPPEGISADARPTLVANTNVQFAEKVKREAGIATRTVGLIAAPKQAEAIIAEGKADMVALARAMLDDPHWGWRAAHVLGAEVVRPKQYQRASPKVWAGAAFRD